MKATEREKRILSDLIIALMIEIVELKARIAELEAEGTGETLLPR